MTSYIHKLTQMRHHISGDIGCHKFTLTNWALDPNITITMLHNIWEEKLASHRALHMKEVGGGVMGGLSLGGRGWVESRE